MSALRGDLQSSPSRRINNHDGFRTTGAVPLLDRPRVVVDEEEGTPPPPASGAKFIFATLILVLLAGAAVAVIIMQNSEASQGASESSAPSSAVVRLRSAGSTRLFFFQTHVGRAFPTLTAAPPAARSADRLLDARVPYYRPGRAQRVRLRRRLGRRRLRSAQVHVVHAGAVRVRRDVRRLGQRLPPPLHTHCAELSAERRC